jgi:hypothetical protein
MRTSNEKPHNVLIYVALFLFSIGFLSDTVSGQVLKHITKTSQQFYFSNNNQPLERMGMIESVDKGATWEFKGYAQFHAPQLIPVDPSVLYDNGDLVLYFFDLLSLMTKTAVVYRSVAKDNTGLDFFPPDRAFEFQGFMTDPAVVKLPDDMYKMYVHCEVGILSATSFDGTVFTLDQGERTREGGIPGALLLPDGRIRLFACCELGIISLISEDAMMFDQEPDVRLPVPEGVFVIGDPDPIMISDGTYRMAYKIRPAEIEGAPIDDEVYLAESEDGFNWIPRSTPLVKGCVPTLVELPDGRLRIYFVDFDLRPSLIEQNERTPEELYLEQNYPNPFNPSTTIKFSLSKHQHTILKVYNPNGQEVAVLCNEVMGPGIFTIVFNAKDLISGIYFYRLQGADFTETKKFVVLR